MIELTDVSTDNVTAVVENFILAGKIKITIEQQLDGNWTIRGE